MATYTENDVQNALADVRNSCTLATAATVYGVPRNTLHRHLSSAQSYQHAYENEQRLLTT